MHFFAIVVQWTIGIVTGNHQQFVPVFPHLEYLAFQRASLLKLSFIDLHYQTQCNGNPMFEDVCSDLV